MASRKRDTSDPAEPAEAGAVAVPLPGVAPPAQRRRMDSPGAVDPSPMDVVD